MEGDPPVAYLVSRYPHLSHAFITREVAAVRAAGLEVVTMSVHPADAEGLLSAADRAEAQTTLVIQGEDRVRRAVKATVRAIRESPRAFVQTLARALNTGPTDSRHRRLQLFYFVESLIAYDLLRPTRARHLHVHFPNNAADIARLLVAYGNAAGTGPWTWSLAMHGPTEFADVPGHDLRAKLIDASFVACISDYARSQAMALTMPEAWANFHLVRMSVDAQRYPLAERQPHDGPLRVLFVGRLVSEKGPDLLLDAVRLLGAGVASVRIVGSGPLRAHLQHRAQALTGVTVVGPLGQDDLPTEYAAADVFCLPSAAEGLPVVLMEAMATGLPVVTTRITGIPELVVDRHTGLLVTAGRADLVADALRQLAADSELRRRLGLAGRERVLRDHNASGQAEVLVQLFRRARGGAHLVMTTLTTVATLLAP